MNHTTDECLLKHRYPPWYKLKNDRDRVVNSVVNHNKNVNVTDKTDNINQESQEDIQFT